MPVQQYPYITVGIQATIDTLLNGYYPDIVQSLRSSTPRQQWSAQAHTQVTKWGTNTAFLSNSVAQPPTYPTPWHSWATGVLNGIGAPPTDVNLQTLWAWTTYEKPAPTAINSMQFNNPLNTTQTEAGSTDISSGAAGSNSGTSGGNNPSTGSGSGNDPFGIGSALGSFGSNLNKEITGQATIAAGLLLMLAGVAILVLMAIRGAAPAAAQVAQFATPAGRAAVLAGAALKPSSAPPARPAPQPLSPNAQAAVAAARAGRGSKLSPQVKTELRGRAA